MGQSDGDAATGVVRHEADRQRFVAVVDGTEAELTYTRREGVMTLTHTLVPPVIGGRGIAADLVRTALALARSEHLKVVPACSYVATYFKRHPQESDLLAD